MKRPGSDLQAFYEAVKPVQVRPDGPYTPEERFRDFHQLFFGSEMGRRVLAQILDECEDRPITLNQVESHAYLAFRAGKREVGQKIVMWMHAVPPDDVMIEREKDDDR